MNLFNLFDEAKELDYSHSNGMICVEKMKGPGFFPGCMGTINSVDNLKDLQIMVLGQDFDTAENHKRIDEVKGEINDNTTWSNLKKLLTDLNIDVNKCFFTNAYMGLRPDIKKGSKTKNTGQSPALKEKQNSLHWIVINFLSCN